MNRDKPLWGLLRHRELLVPTGRGWLLLLALCIGSVFGLARGVHPFLAVNDPNSGGAVVVEGWATVHAFKEVVAEFKRNQYSHLYVTGGPIDEDASPSEYKTTAERGAAIAIRLGLASSEVQAVPAPKVLQDRTYASAVALRDWLRVHQIATKNFHVLSVGPHARRTRLLFEKALGEGVTVGITAIQSDGYDPNAWWTTSEGVRTLIGEIIAYGYARLMFWPAKQ